MASTKAQRIQGVVEIVGQWTGGDGVPPPLNLEFGQSCAELSGKVEQASLAVGKVYGWVSKALQPKHSHGIWQPGTYHADRIRRARPKSMHSEIRAAEKMTPSELKILGG